MNTTIQQRNSSYIWYPSRTQKPTKQIIVWKVTTHIGNKGNEEADREKQAIDMPGMTTTRLPYTGSSQFTTAATYNV